MTTSCFTIQWRTPTLPTLGARTDTDTALPFPRENRSHNDIDWEGPQNARNMFSQRLANAYFANTWCSDISIYIPIDDHTVPAHCFVLAAASPVLQRCCFGTGTLGGDKTITVPEYCSTEVVLIVLRYLYVGGDAVGINESNVAQVLKMADYFELCELQKQCEALSESLMSVDNVCSFFRDIHNINTDLVAKCMDYMLRHTTAILENGSALQMEYPALLKLLAPENMLSINNETVLVRAMVKWADAQFDETDSVATPKNRREVLGDRVYLVCFGAMIYGEFMKANHSLGRGFFTDEEVSLTVQQISLRGQTGLQMSYQLQFPFSAVMRSQQEYTAKKSYVDIFMKTATKKSPSDQSVFKLDASGLDLFKLTEIVLCNTITSNQQLEIFKNGETDPLPYYLITSKIIFHDPGLCPDNNQQISLRMKMNGFAFTTLLIQDNQPSSPNSPRVLGIGEQCAVRSFTYTSCPDFI